MLQLYESAANNEAPFFPGHSKIEQQKLAFVFNSIRKGDRISTVPAFITDDPPASSEHRHCIRADKPCMRATVLPYRFANRATSQIVPLRSRASSRHTSNLHSIICAAYTIGKNFQWLQGTSSPFRHRPTTLGASSPGELARWP